MCYTCSIVCIHRILVHFGLLSVGVAIPSSPSPSHHQRTLFNFYFFSTHHTGWCFYMHSMCRIHRTHSHMHFAFTEIRMKQIAFRQHFYSMGVRHSMYSTVYILCTVYTQCRHMYITKFTEPAINPISYFVSYVDA